MATDAEVAQEANAILFSQKQQPDLTAKEQADFPWLNKYGDQPTATDQAAQEPQHTAQELEDFPWLARQEKPQQAAVSDDLVKAAVAAYDQTRNPLQWAEDVAKGQIKASPGYRMGEFALTAAKRIGEDVTGIAGTASRLAGLGVQAGQDVSVGALGVQIPNLQGMSVPQVKALREQMLAQREDLSKRQDQIINSGTPDEYGLYGYLQATHGLDQRIKDADAIIASGKPQIGPSGTTEMLAQGLNYGGHTVAPAVSKFIDKVIPTDEEFNNSFAATVARGGADAISLAPVGALTGGIGTVVAGGLLYGGNATYQDAKAHGASDEEADRASLMSTLGTSAIMAVGSPVVGALAKSFSGLTAKAGMNAIVQAGTYIGTRVAGTSAEFTSMNMVQNAVARLSGYDPDRKLDQGNWENFWTGIMYSGVHLATEDIPHIHKMFKPDVTVRNKDGTPAQTGEQTQTPVTRTGPAPVVLGPGEVHAMTPEELAAEGQPQIVLGTINVGQQAETAARATATQTPEQTIAQANPEAELDKFMAQMGQQRQAQPTTAPQPTTTAERTTAPSTLDVLDAKHAINEAHTAGHIDEGRAIALSQLAETDPQGALAQLQRGFVQAGGTAPTYTGPERPVRQTLQLGGGERDAAAMPPAATEHGAEPVPSNTPGPPTTVEAPHAAPTEAAPTTEQLLEKRAFDVYQDRIRSGKGDRTDGVTPEDRAEAARQIREKTDPARDWLDSLTKEERYALDKWLGLGPPSVIGDPDWESAMAKAPTYNGKVFRGLENLDDSTFERLKKEGLTIPSNSSASANPEIAKDFARINFEGPKEGKHAVVLELNGQSKAINPEARRELGIGIPYQKEVILPKGNTYRVTDVRENAYGPNQHHVVLEQEAPTVPRAEEPKAGQVGKTTMQNLEVEDTPENRAAAQRMVDEETRRSVEIVYDQIQHNQGAVSYEALRKQVGTETSDAQLRPIWEELQQQKGGAAETGEAPKPYRIIRQPEEVAADTQRAKQDQQLLAPPSDFKGKKGGYWVRWEDATRPEHDLSRNQQRAFTSKKAASDFVRQLKKGANVTIRLDKMLRPGEMPDWYTAKYPEKAGVPEAPTEENPEPKPENNSPQRRAWYEGEDFANIPPVARPEPPDRAVTPADVKKEVNDAQEQMGMEDHLHYVANVEALPDHVKAGLTEGERGGSAQIVRDNKLGNIYVIGDRFDSLNDLRRKIVEETVPYHYRNVTKIGLTHDNTDPRTGYYDWLADRPVLNTHAIISQEQPYSAAMKTAMHEADGHQGFSRLLGDRNGPIYTGVMQQLLQNFRRLGIIDTLAQMRGYENAQHMAQAYGVPKWETDPRQANKFTEELAAGYTHNFRNSDELMANGPTWWQNGLRRLNNGIRQFLGIRLSDYDVQSLLADSAHALRKPKWTDSENQFKSPIGEEAKRDAQAFQMANLPPTETTFPPEKTATEAGETADIGSEFVKAKARNLRATLKTDQEIRAGALKIAMDKSHGIQERMNVLNKAPAVYTREGQGMVMQAAQRTFEEDLHGDVHEALEYLTNNAATEGPGANNPKLVKVVDRETDRQIDQLAKAGQTQQANILRAKLDRMNMEQVPRRTEVARELGAVDRTGSSMVAQHKHRIQQIQQQATSGSPGKQARGEKVTKALGEVKQATEAAAKSLRDKFVEMAQRHGITDLTKSLPEQYMDALVNWMRDKFADTGTESSTEMLAPVEQAFDTFKKNFYDIIKQKDTTQPRPRMQISPASTLNEIMTNYPQYREAWHRTIEELNYHNPALAQRFADVADGPIGEPLANKLAAEQGVKLSDLIYNHYSVNDRMMTDLARQIASRTDIHPLEAEALTSHLDNLFGDIIEKEQGKRLQSILDSVGGHFKPAKSELQRLLNHITIGALDSKEWMNIVAPRFGIENITPEQERGLRAAGDWLVKMQDYGLAGSAAGQWARTLIGDLMSSKLVPPAMRKNWDRLNYGLNVLITSLISNPITHIPYWQGMMISEGINSAIHGIRTYRDTGDTKVFLKQVLGGIEGFKRGWREAGPIFRGGYKAEHEFLPQYLGEMRSSPLDRVPVKYHNFAWYKYVRNALDAVSNIIVRGGQGAVGQALAHHLAWEKGLSGQEAYDYADQVVYGSKEHQAEADRRSHEIVDQMHEIDPDHPISEDARRLMREQILDQLKTSSDDLDEAQQKLDVNRRAQRSASRAALRGDVYGFWGRVSKLFSRMGVENPETKIVVPFVNVPFNLVNELSAWGPLGVFRSAKDLVPEDSWIASRLEQIPSIGEGVTGFIKNVPGMKQKLENPMGEKYTGEFSPDAIRDLAMEQMIRGLVGGGVFAGAGALIASAAGNPNPPWKLTYNGPSNYNAQQAEKGKGWIPHAMYLGDWAGPWKGWHSYENLPLRSVFAALGSLSDYYRYDRKPEDSDGNAAYHAFLRMPSAWFSSTFGSPLQGLETMLSNIVHSGGSANPQREFGQFLTQQIAAAATIPVGGAAARAAWRLKDPREFEANDMLGKSLRYIPVVNSMFLKPKLNIFGQPMTASPFEKIPEYSPTSGFGLGLGGVIDKDPVWDYLDRHPGIKLSLPGPSSVVAGIRTSPDETRVYHEQRGVELRKQIERAIASPQFRAEPVDVQNFRVHEIFEKIANRVGEVAVMRYRQAGHPVTPERQAQSRIGKLQAIMKEEQSVSTPEE